MAKQNLKAYQRKRDFSKTPEPKGRSSKSKKGDLRFVVQWHHASRPHFDLRLEFDGVFKSWAVPKGPSLNPHDRRLAVFVEDHPLEYGSFEGIIPEGNYGAGTVMVWDSGTYVERNSKDRNQSQSAMLKGLEKGHMTFVVKGKKINGEFALVRLKGEDGKNWLLLKKHDSFASSKRNQNFEETSVKTGRTMDEIREQAEKKGAIWLSKRKTKPTPKPVARKTKPAASKQDPMPRKVKPMLATSAREAPEGKDWIFEPAQDGLRAIAEVENKTVHLYSRSGLGFEKKFPQVVQSLKDLKLHAVLDGEIIKNKSKHIFSVFDILYADGKDLRKTPLRERKKILEKNLKGNSLVQITPNSEKAGSDEVIAKDANSFYSSGTSKDWQKFVSAAKDKKSKNKTKSKSTSTAAALEQPQLTNLDKVFWPKEGYTKGDLINYYKSAAPLILPYLIDRPQSLNRHPNGIESEGFYQKDLTGHIPRWLKTERIYSESSDKTINYALCQDERSLLYLVNLGCIELNPWFSRVPKLDHPDFLVIDLDPDGNPFNHVVEIALEVHTLLNSVGAVSFCKTSGSSGIHIGVPLGARYTFDQAREFAENVCRLLAKKFPATTSVERTPARRRKKIYLDFLQNRRGQTLAAPFCVRPKEKAPVSMPLNWTDLRPGLKPEQFHIKNAMRLMRGKPDPWKGVLGDPIDLEKCGAKLRRKTKA